MKTFLLNIPQRLKLKSQELDAQAALCDKPWTVFNDEGVKQLFIFQPDGTLLITTNGIVSNSTWKYISANRSIIITSDNKSVMFHPAFLDDVVFALQQDGEGSSLFMIDENNSQSFSPKNLTELGAYFSNKEQILIEAEQQEERRREAERIQLEEIRLQQIEKEKEEEEKRRIAEEEENRREAERRAEAERLNQRREAIRKEYAEEIQCLRNKAQKRSDLKYPGFAIVIVGILCVCIGSGFSFLIVGLSGAFFFILGLVLVAYGDYDPDLAERYFIDAKMEKTE